MITVRAYMGEDLMLVDDFTINHMDNFIFYSDMFCADYCYENELERVHGHFEALDENGELIEVYEVHYYLGNPA